MGAWMYSYLCPAYSVPKGATLFTGQTSISANLLMWISLLIVAGFSGCGGSGTNGGSTTTYTIGGSVSGLASGATLALQDNAADNLTIEADGTFTFATKLSSAATYNVSLLTQPATQNCGVANGSGAVA